MHTCILFFNDPEPTEIYTLALHDAIPISAVFRLRLAGLGFGLGVGLGLSVCFPRVKHSDSLTRQNFNLHRMKWK